MRAIRVFDVIGAVIGLILFLPILLIAAVAIKLDSQGPILFTQERVGQDNGIFTIYKLRTMYIGTPEMAKASLRSTGELDRRVTKVGRILRRTSVDELPQLFNVLIGNMSLVGPRPALPSQYDLIHMRTEVGVHRLRPGITGPAQVEGREELSLRDKVEYDRMLVGGLSLSYYLGLILKTAVILFRQRGTY